MNHSSKIQYVILQNLWSGLDEIKNEVFCHEMLDQKDNPIFAWIDFQIRFQSS